MPPPPAATSVAPRFLLGPALRTQSDGRLVALVREGYETAFEEIVRRYGQALGRYAAAIVPNHRAEDVTQDAFSKALLALRGTDKEIELRPWLYRIVRNTALNDLRDQPAAAAPLLDTAQAPSSVAEQIESREELKDLMRRLGELPDSQRAAIVMRELEGLSHEEIAAALGISGGAARQAIHRARVGLRDGIGMLLPLPILRWMLAGGSGVAGEATSTAGGAIAGAAGGAGTGIAIKAAAATVLVAGSVGTGVAIHERGGERDVASANTVSKKVGGREAGASAPGTAALTSGEDGAASDSGSGAGTPSEGAVGTVEGSGLGGDDARGVESSGGLSSSSGHGSDDDGSGSGPGTSEDTGDDGDDGSHGPGSGPLVTAPAPGGGQGGDGSGSGHDGGSGSGHDGGSGSGYSGGSGSGYNGGSGGGGPGPYHSGSESGGSGSGGTRDPVPAPAPAPPVGASGSGYETGYSGSSGSGSSGSGSGHQPAAVDAVASP